MTIEELIKKNLFVLYIIIIISGTYIQSKSSDAAYRTSLRNKEYHKISILSNKLNKCNKTKNAFKNNLFSFVQILKKENHLNGKILSVTPMLNENRETLDIKLKKLNLKQSLNIIEKVGSYSNVYVKQFALTKNFAINNLMNLDSVVQKAK